MSLEANCPILLFDSGGSLKESELQADLENKDDAIKIKALKNIIRATVNGQPFPKLLMPVIKFTLHSRNHLIKKLCLLYWEVVEKRQPNGKLLHEMILVCNALKNNITHPNEYIRGSTLRFLCRLREADILESGLISSILDNLQHRHSYVRKNAVMCLYTVYQSFPELVPDAPEVVENFLGQETNPTAKRNAFLMLVHCAPDRAVNYLASVIQTISALPESFQLLVLELIKKTCRSNPLAKSQYIQCLYGLVNSPSAAVAFEGANTLVSLSNAPTAVRAAVGGYCQLLSKESDNNIRLVILGRLSGLKRRNEKILQEMLMDILRTLSSPNIDIRRKTLELALELVSARNVDDVVTLLKKEIQTTGSSAGKADDYRKLLVETMHKCAVKFPEVVQNVVHLLINFLGDENAANALDVVLFVREIVEEYPALREGILTKLIENLAEIRAATVFRIALWILGEYAEGQLLDLSLLTVRELLGPLSFKEDKKEEAVEEVDALGKRKAGPVVLADGTYAMASAVSERKGEVSNAIIPNANSNLRSLIMGGEFFLAGCVSNSMTKLSLKFAQLNGWNARESHEELAKTQLLCVSLLRFGESNPERLMDPDSRARILMCLRVLQEPSKLMELFMGKSRETFVHLLQENRKKQLAAQKEGKSTEVLSQCDELLSLRLLKKGDGMDDFDGDDVQQAMGLKNNKLTKINRIYQLTGCADPVYVEAQLSVLDYDICLAILVVNQTDQILQNVTVELNTSGDLKLVERPIPFTLKAHGSHKLTANIKVTSTESGVIFGSVVYSTANGVNQTVVVMSNIYMDIMDYIGPSATPDQNFRSMWAEFEWENKVMVNTDITNLNDYLEHLEKITNMKCMTPPNNMTGNCQFLAANLYARSIFGEEALLNLSVEMQNTGKIMGYIRIRSKTQGIALALGDKINAKQRTMSKS